MSSAASEVTLACFGLCIIRAMQPSAAGGKTGECVAIRSRRSWPASTSLRRNAIVFGGLV